MSDLGALARLERLAARHKHDALYSASGHTHAYSADTHLHAAQYVDTGGDTMTGLLVLSADPSAALGAATKQYVDGKSTTATWTVDSGWVDYGSPFTGLHASRTGNIVTVSGLLKKASADLTPTVNAPFTISTTGIPSGFRPSTTVISTGLCTTTTQSNAVCRLDFDSAGKIQGHINVAGTFTNGVGWISINATYRAA